MCSEDIALPYSKSRGCQNRLSLLMWGCQSDEAILKQGVISAYNNANSHRPATAVRYLNPVALFGIIVYPVFVVSTCCRVICDVGRKKESAE